MDAASWLPKLLRIRDGWVSSSKQVTYTIHTEPQWTVRKRKLVQSTKSSCLQSIREIRNVEFAGFPLQWKGFTMVNPQGKLGLNLVNDLMVSCFLLSQALHKDQWLLGLSQTPECCFWVYRTCSYERSPMYFGKEFCCSYILSIILIIITRKIFFKVVLYLNTSKINF